MYILFPHVLSPTGPFLLTVIVKCTLGAKLIYKYHTSTSDYRQDARETVLFHHLTVILTQWNIILLQNCVAVVTNYVPGYKKAEEITYHLSMKDLEDD